jgi:hypothetical protein
VSVPRWLLLLEPGPLEMRVGFPRRPTATHVLFLRRWLKWQGSGAHLVAPVENSGRYVRDSKSYLMG